VLFAVSIGPLVQFFLPLFDTAAPARQAEAPKSRPGELSLQREATRPFGKI
jgi:hypothetical protein